MMEIEVQTDESVVTAAAPRTPQPTAPRISIVAKLESRENQAVHYRMQRTRPLGFRWGSSHTGRPKTNIPTRKRCKAHSQATPALGGLPALLLHTLESISARRRPSLKLPLLEKVPRRLVPLKKTLEMQCSPFDKYFK